MDLLQISRWLTIAAIAAVSYLLLLAWQADYVTPLVNSVTTQQLSDSSASSNTTNNNVSSQQLVVTQTPAQSLEDDLPELGAKAGMTTAIETAVQRENLVQVKTDVLDVTINLHGGDIIGVKLLNYPQQLNGQKSVIILDQSAQHTFVAQSGVLSATGKDLDQEGRPRFSSSVKNYDMNNGVLEVPLTLLTDTLKVTKTYRFHPGKYLVELSYSVENIGNKPWLGSFFAQLKRDKQPDPGAQGGSFGLPTFLGMAYWAEDKRYNKLDFDDIDSANKKNTYALDETIPGGWAAWVQHYFLSAWIPAPEGSYRYNARRNTQDHYIIGLTSTQPTVIQPSEIAKYSAHLFVGPKVERNLKDISDGLNLAVDYGWLFMISKLLFRVLEFIHSYVGNWGVAIILLTCFVKALFLYPSAISYRSMARMRQMQPEMTRIKDLYSNDRQKVSQEMIKLYQREKINPFGGCLPVLMQMPVFIALYWALLESVELRHAPFFGWIQDLSSMDPYFILPLLMGVSMFIQMQLNPTPPDPTQAKVMKVMPIIFTLFFLFFPAGLVLYWLTNNVLSILQQWMISKQIEKSAA